MAQDKDSSTKNNATSAELDETYIKSIEAKLLQGEPLTIPQQAAYGKWLESEREREREEIRDLYERPAGDHRLTRQVLSFFNLADDELIKRAPTREFFLLIANLIRLLLGATFAFLIFFYALSTVLPNWQAAIISIVMALIVMFMDQAIIGSALVDTGQWIWRFLRTLFRIAFAIAVALFMATLAEITFQRKAIEKYVLEPEQSVANASGQTQQSLLTKKLRGIRDAYQIEIDAVENRYQNELRSIDNTIDELKREQRTFENLIGRATGDSGLLGGDSELEREIQRLENEIFNARKELAELERQRTEQNNRLRELQQVALLEKDRRLSELDTQLAPILDSQVYEVQVNCRIPGSEFCKGPLWRDLEVQRVALQADKDKIENEKDTLEFEAARLDANIKELDVEIDNLRLTLDGSDADLIGRESGLQDKLDQAIIARNRVESGQANNNLADIEQKVTAQQREKDSLINQRDIELATLRDLRAKDQNTEINKSEEPAGPLELYIGLDKLKNLTDKDVAAIETAAKQGTTQLPAQSEVQVQTELSNEAKAARYFSYLIKSVIILFELSPILVALFFMPFSGVALMMQRRRKDDEVTQHMVHIDTLKKQQHKENDFLMTKKGLDAINRKKFDEDLAEKRKHIVQQKAAFEINGEIPETSAEAVNKPIPTPPPPNETGGSDKNPETPETPEPPNQAGKQQDEK